VYTENLERKIMLKFYEKLYYNIVMSMKKSLPKDTTPPFLVVIVVLNMFFAFNLFLIFIMADFFKIDIPILFYEILYAIALIVQIYYLRGGYDKIIINRYKSKHKKTMVIGNIYIVISLFSPITTYLLLY